MRCLIKTQSIIFLYHPNSIRTLLLKIGCTKRNYNSLSLTDKDCILEYFNIHDQNSFSEKIPDLLQ